MEELRQKRKKRRKLLSLSGLIAVLMLAVLLNRAILQWRVEQKLDEIRADGYPATLEELNQWYPQPEGKNAADLYLAAFDKFVEWDEKPIPRNVRIELGIESPESERPRMMPGMGPGMIGPPGMLMPGMRVPTPGQWDPNGSAGQAFPGMMPGAPQGQEQNEVTPEDWHTRNLDLLPIIGNKIEDTQPGCALPDIVITAIEDFLADNAEAMKLLHEAALVEECSFRGGGK